jgi:hypothetical protein
VPRMILLLAVALTLIILIRRAQRQPPHKRRGAYLQIMLGSAVVGVIILTLMGKMHWIGAALTGALVLARQTLPLLIRILPMLGGLRGQNANSAGKQSEVSSRILRMTLDHDSGDLSGVVLEGTYRDWLLEELEREQLDDLMAFCQREDADSAKLLASYLEQRFPDDAGHTEHNSHGGTANAAGVTRAEALAVLGLREGASEEDIVAAHRTLIQRLHPDRGGNDYLAAKINEAKDFLID